MSVIRKLPYIEALLASMTDANLKDLRTVVNTGGSNVNLDFEHLTAATYKNKVTPVYFKFEDNGLKTGILIWTNSMCALICYHRFQDLIIFELSPTYHTSKKINEYCDINELRRVLDDTIEAKGLIESGGAAANTILTADGDGGTSWEDVKDVIKDADIPNGSAAYLVGLDSEGNVIKDELPEGIVVDQTIVEDSTNAVAGGAVYDELAEIKSDITELEDTKANKDGNYATLGAGHADSAAALDTTVGNDDNTPFAYQTSGGSADVETGMQGLNKLVGCDVVKNQEIYNPSFTNGTSGWDTSGEGLSASGGIASFTANASNGWCLQTNKQRIGGHQYLCTAKIKLTTYSPYIYFRTYLGDASTAQNILQNTTSWQTIFVIKTAQGTDSNSNFGIYDARLDGFDAIQFTDVFVIDLTQRYGSNEVVNAIIGATNQVENLLKFDANILVDTTYDTGTLVSSKSAKLKTVGYNQWDEEATTGGIEGLGGSSNLTSENYIDVIGGATYYFKFPVNTQLYFFAYDAQKNLIKGQGYQTGDYWILHTSGTATLPINARYIKFLMSSEYGTTYNHDICIFLYWDGSKITYEPYEEHEYELPDKEQHGVLAVSNGKVVADGDELYPDGNGKTRYGVYTFTGTEGYGWDSDGYWYSSNFLPENAQGKATDTLTNKGLIGAIQGDNRTIRFYVSNNPQLSSSVSPATILTNGDKMIYALKNEIDLTNQGIFAENIYADDFGTMQFLNTLGNQIAGLQGANILYKANIAGFAESLYVKTNGDVDDLVTQAELTIVDNKIGAKLPACPATTDGTYVLKAIVTDGEVTYEWVSEV